jgi:hypothetical protein
MRPRAKLAQLSENITELRVVLRLLIVENVFNRLPH